MLVSVNFEIDHAHSNLKSIKLPVDSYKNFDKIWLIDEDSLIVMWILKKYHHMKKMKKLGRVEC